MDDSRMETIFKVISEADVDLDYDPIAKGPKFLNRKVAHCRNLTNDIQKLEREIEIEILMHGRKLNTLETEYEIKMNDKLSNDVEVKRLSSVSDRKAKAKDLLKDLYLEIEEARQDLTDLQHISSVVQSKLRELREVTSNIRLQRQLIKHEMDLDTYQGDNVGDYDTSRKIDPKDIDVEEEEEDIDLSEIIGDDDSDEDPDPIFPEDDSEEGHHDEFDSFMSSTDNGSEHIDSILDEAERGYEIDDEDDIDFDALLGDF